MNTSIFNQPPYAESQNQSKLTEEAPRANYYKELQETLHNYRNSFGEEKKTHMDNLKALKAEIERHQNPEDYNQSIKMNPEIGLSKVKRTETQEQKRARIREEVKAKYRTTGKQEIIHDNLSILDKNTERRPLTKIDIENYQARMEQADWDKGKFDSTIDFINQNQKLWTENNPKRNKYWEIFAKVQAEGLVNNIADKVFEINKQLSVYSQKNKIKIDLLKRPKNDELIVQCQNLILEQAQILEGNNTSNLEITKNDVMEKILQIMVNVIAYDSEILGDRMPDDGFWVDKNGDLKPNILE